MKDFYYTLHNVSIEINANDLGYIHPKLSLCILRSNLYVLENKKERFLHIQELARLATYRFPLRRKSYLLGRISAKKAINFYLNHHRPYHEILIENGLYGEPKVIGNHVNVSISHSHDYAVCLVASNLIKIGIDIEDITNIHERDLHNIIDQREINLFKKLDFSKSKINIWLALDG